MQARREDYAKVMRRDAERDEPTREQVYDLRAARRARRVRDDNQHALAGAQDIFERLRVYGVVNRRADLRVRQRQLLRRFRLQPTKAPALELEGERAAPVA